jgi:hypothetical protein
MMVLALVGATLLNHSAAAEIEPDHHPWARFQPGAWKLVRVITETLDEKGAVTSTSKAETKTTLMNVEQDRVVLEKDVCVEIAGRRFDADPVTVYEGLHGESINGGASLKEVGAGKTTIEGREIPCRILQLESNDAIQNTVTKLYFSSTEAPYILKRETVKTDPKDKKVLQRQTVEVIAQEMPQKVLAEMKATAIISSIHKHPKGTITRYRQLAADVPGGIVSESTKELDTEGRIIRRSTLELLEYSSEPEVSRTGLFGRRRPTRFRKVSPRPR